MVALSENQTKTQPSHRNQHTTNKIMMDPPQVVLVQFRPAWAAQAYLRFAGTDHHIDQWHYPSCAATGPLPQLRHGTRLIPASDIISYLRESFKDLDAALSPRQRAQSAAFSQLVQHTLESALQASRWSDIDHYERVTRPQLLQSMPFPLNRVWIWHRRRRVLRQVAESSLAESTGMARSDAVAPDFDLDTPSTDYAASAIVANALSATREAYKALSEQLGESVWLLGTPRPSSADAVLFGHLAEAQTEPLANVLREFPGLMTYFARVTRAFFEQVPVGLTVFTTRGTHDSVFMTAIKPRLALCSTANRAAPLAIPTTAERTQRRKKELNEEREVRRRKRAAMGLPDEEDEDGGQGTLWRNRVWLGVAAGAMFVYFVVANIGAIQYVAAQLSDDDDDEEEEDDDEEEGEKGDNYYYDYDDDDEVFDEDVDDDEDDGIDG